MRLRIHCEQEIVPALTLLTVLLGKQIFTTCVRRVYRHGML